MAWWYEVLACVIPDKGIEGVTHAGAGLRWLRSIGKERLREIDALREMDWAK